MGKIIIDILTPKQARFFHVVGEKIKKNNNEVIYTTRNYVEVNAMLKLMKIKYKKIGKFGKDKLEKLICSTKRQLNYALLLNKEKPDVVLSFGSPEAARAAFGLGIPHLMANDSPHSIFVMKLTIPLSNYLFSPKCIPIEEWEKFGISSDNIITYDAIDQVAWLRNIYLKEIIESLEEESYTNRTLIYRPEEFFASYVSHEFPKSLYILEKAIKEFYRRNKIKIDIIVLARYAETSFYKRLSKYANVSIPSTPVDAVKLLLRARAFLGVGGTMTGEAALIGLFTASVSERENFIERFLVRRKLISRIEDTKSLCNFLEEAMFSTEEELKSKRKKGLSYLKRMEDPSEVIAQFLQKKFL